MGKGLSRSMARAGNSAATIQKSTLSLNGKTITVDGATGVGFGSLAFGGFREGNIMLLGAVGYVGISTESTDVTVDFEGDLAVGSTPASDGTLSAGDADIIPSSAIGPASTRAIAEARFTQDDGSICGVVLDNTDGSLELNLNLLIDDADISADGVELTLTGVLVIAYIVLGDD